MKKWLIFTLVTSGVFAQDYPKLFFQYGSIFDRQCVELNKFKTKSGEEIVKYELKPEWSLEARTRNDEFQQIWDKESTTLFSTLFEITGKKFSRKELTTYTTVCNVPSMSQPLMINIKKWLMSFMDPKPVAPVIGFIDVVFHEFLHNFVVENLRRSRSVLLEKYKSESDLVKNHLHLMALQKAVYLKLNRQDYLTWIDQDYKKFNNDYTRAWLIVNQLEDHEQFLNEIRR